MVGVGWEVRLKGSRYLNIRGRNYLLQGKEEEEDEIIVAVVVSL